MFVGVQLQAVIFILAGKYLKILGLSAYIISKTTKSQYIL